MSFTFSVVETLQESPFGNLRVCEVLLDREPKRALVFLNRAAYVLGEDHPNIKEVRTQLANRIK